MECIAKKLSHFHRHAQSLDLESGLFSIQGPRRCALGSVSGFIHPLSDLASPNGLVGARLGPLARPAHAARLISQIQDAGYHTVSGHHAPWATKR